MSSKKSEKILHNNTAKRQLLIIKGFRLMPTVLKFVKYSGKSIVVLCRDGKTLMNFAKDVVFQYDEKNFKNLCEAFESGDKERLEQEWQKAKPITST